MRTRPDRRRASSPARGGCRRDNSIAINERAKKHLKGLTYRHLSSQDTNCEKASKEAGGSGCAWRLRNESWEWRTRIEDVRPRRAGLRHRVWLFLSRIGIGFRQRRVWFRLPSGHFKWPPFEILSNCVPVSLHCIQVHDERGWPQICKTKSRGDKPNGDEQNQED